jgi:hypothetical protein
LALGLYGLNLAAAIRGCGNLGEIRLGFRLALKETGIDHVMHCNAGEIAQQNDCPYPELQAQSEANI